MRHRSSKPMHFCTNVAPVAAATEVGAWYDGILVQRHAQPLSQVASDSGISQLPIWIHPRQQVTLVNGGPTRHFSRPPSFSPHLPPSHSLSSDASQVCTRSTAHHRPCDQDPVQSGTRGDVQPWLGALFALSLPLSH